MTETTEVTPGMKLRLYTQDSLCLDRLSTHTGAPGVSRMGLQGRNLAQPSGGCELAACLQESAFERVFREESSES